MRIRPLLSAALLIGISASIATAQTAEITGRFNPAKAILPCSQYTPDEPYQASVWVLNTGQRYSDNHYNHVWGAPDTDSSGHNWYEVDYNQGDVDGWAPATAPFSSDDYYKGHKSYRWVTVDIMAEIYLRRSFTLSSLPAGLIFLATGHDDGPSEWYINGQLVYTISDGWNNDDYVLLTDEQKSLLKTDGSENIIAVHVHQNWGGAFADCGLYEADMSRATTLLNTVAAGPWPCRYYMLNYNSDISVAEAARWASAEEDETDWVDSIGPMSNDRNMFLTTKWPSQVRPILVRRHFNLDTDILTAIEDTEVRLLCSYDENPKVYLNGTLIWSASGWNDNDYASYILSDEHKQLLHSGDNVLAVSLTQGGGGGHIDYGLQMVAPYDPTDEPAGTLLPTADSSARDKRVFNLQGQYLGTHTEGLAPGLYIAGGKKIIVK